MSGRIRELCELGLGRTHTGSSSLLMRCSSVADEREKLVRLMREEVVEWQNLEDSERVTAVLSYACRSSGVGRSVERVWQKRFVTSA